MTKDTCTALCSSLDELRDALNELAHQFKTQHEEDLHARARFLSLQVQSLCYDTVKRTLDRNTE